MTAMMTIPTLSKFFKLDGVVGMRGTRTSTTSYYPLQQPTFVHQVYN